MARASNSTGKAALAAILKGLEGVTPGPWMRSGIQQKRLDRNGPFLAAGPDGACVFFSPTGRTHNDHANCIRDLDHIARCDPGTMRKIGEYVAELEKDVAFLSQQLGIIEHEQDHEAILKVTAKYA